MSKRWSKLQSRLYNIIDPKVDFQIHCALYEMNSNDGYHGEKLPRYWITVGKDIIYDYPAMFDTRIKLNYRNGDDGLTEGYPWINAMSNISDSIERYIEMPKEMLMYPVDNDITGITEILRTCDKRIGKRRLRVIYENCEDTMLREIIEKRLF